MTVSAEIKAAQEAYAARPVFVYWVDSHAKVPSRFHTLSDAFGYIDTQWSRIRRAVASERYRASHLRQGFIEAPELGRVSLSHLLLAEDVSSY